MITHSYHMLLRGMIFFAVGSLLFFVDYISKEWINEHLPLMSPAMPYPYGGIGVFEDFFGVSFSITHLDNVGAAWGTLGDYPHVLIGLRILLISFLFIYLLFFEASQSMTMPLVLLISGALGNIKDYFLYGHVIDMFHFTFNGTDFPVFNVADSAVTAAIFWLIFLSFKEKQ